MILSRSILKLSDVKLIFSDLVNFLNKEEFSANILLVTTKGFTRRGITRIIKKCLHDYNLVVLDSVEKEPSIEQIESYYLTLSEKRIDSVLALGGGSVIDTAKILSVILDNSEYGMLINNLTSFNTMNFNSSLPLFVFPTTAGSGAELTPFATIWDDKLKLKYSLQSYFLLPRVAIYDTSLLKSLPLSVSIASGLDTISHALESIWNLTATPITTSISFESLSLSIQSIRDYSTINNDDSLKNMQLASIYAGIAISQTKTGLAHSISYPLTSIYKIPHGIASSFVLPELLLFNSGEDDGRLIKLANYLNYQTVDELYLELYSIREELLSKLTVLDLFNNIDVRILYDKILSPDRSKLNMRQVNSQQAVQILTDALNSIKY